MYITSLMFLVTPCGSFLTMVKHSGLTGCPVELLWCRMRDGGPKMFFELVPKGSVRFSKVFLGAVYMWAFEFVDYPTKRDPSC